MRTLRFAGLLLAIFSTAFNTASADDAKIDIVIKGGRVVDGTGAPWFVADVGIDDGRIVKIGRIAADEADTVIDATGAFNRPYMPQIDGDTFYQGRVIHSFDYEDASSFAGIAKSTLLGSEFVSTIAIV